MRAVATFHPAISLPQDPAVALFRSYRRPEEPAAAAAVPAVADVNGKAAVKASEQAPPPPRRRPMPRTQLLRRLLHIDTLACPRCSTSKQSVPMVVLAFLTDPDVVGRILRHLGLPARDRCPRLMPEDAPPGGACLQPGSMGVSRSRLPGPAGIRRPAAGPREESSNPGAWSCFSLDGHAPPLEKGSQHRWSTDLERCPACRLRPIEEHDLPSAFSSLERVAVTCSHCGARLTTILTGQTDGGVRTAVFKITGEESQGRG